MLVALCIHILGWEGPAIDLDAVKKRNLLPLSGNESQLLGHLTCSLIIILHELSGLTHYLLLYCSYL